MIGLALRVLGFGKKVIGKVLNWVVAHPLQTYAILVTLFAGWLYMHTLPNLMHKLKAEKARSELVLKGQREAYRQQLEMNVRISREYSELAERTDHEVQVAKVHAMDDARRFIAANRVRPGPGCPSGGASSAAEDSSAGGLEGAGGVPQLDGVVVPEADVMICTANTLKAIAGFEWAAKLEAVGEGRAGR